jgi:hypothetical protein
VTVYTTSHTLHSLGLGPMCPSSLLYTVLSKFCNANEFQNMFLITFNISAIPRRWSFHCKSSWCTRTFNVYAFACLRSVILSNIRQSVKIFDKQTYEVRLIWYVPIKAIKIIYVLISILVQFNIIIYRPN